MHGYCSSCIPYFINFMFCAFLFSLLYAKQTDFSPQSSSSFSLDTHKHKHTHTQTQTHRQIITEGASSWSRVQDKLFKLSCRVTRMSLTRWIRALSIWRVMWILGPSLKRHKGGEVSRGLKKSIGIRFSLFFCFGGDVGLIGDVGFDSWSVIWAWSMMSVWMFDRWCGFWSVMWVLRERGRKERGKGRDKEKERRRRIG